MSKMEAPLEAASESLNLLEDWFRQIEAMLIRFQSMTPDPSDLEELVQNRQTLLDQLEALHDQVVFSSELAQNIKAAESKLFVLLRGNLQSRRMELGQLGKLERALAGYGGSATGLSRFVDTHS